MQAEDFRGKPTLKLSYAQRDFIVIRPYIGEELATAEIVIVAPKNGEMVVMR